MFPVLASVVGECMNFVGEEEFEGTAFNVSGEKKKLSIKMYE